jgi:hypothetical protein
MQMRVRIKALLLLAKSLSQKQQLFRVFEEEMQSCEL